MSVLVHSGDAALRAALVECVRRTGHASEAVQAGALAHRLALGDAHVLVLDLAAPDAEQALAALRGAAAPVGLVALVADATPQNLVGALRAGASRLLRKPFGPAQLERAVALAARQHGARLDAPALVAEAPVSRALLARLEALAPTDVSVALHGESGSGKTRVARWLHANGARRAGRFVEVACAELANEVAEGAWCGGPDEALRPRISAAWNGTLVLEEPSQLAPELQARLLVLLEERAHEPLELRVITTSRHPLAEQASRGSLLAELADRLAVVELEVPPLRARREDLPVLARELATLAAAALGEEPPRLDERALAALRRCELPGNVHQLENLMQRAALLFPGQPVEPALFERPHGVGMPLVPPEPRSLSLHELERAAIARALEVSRGNRTRAARALGISVRTLRNKLKRA
jgi:DNA-binding NtrC family response regulator